MTIAVDILPAESRRDIDAVRTLFEEYAVWLEVDLCFQGFSAELAGLPGSYIPPDGRLIIAKIGPEAAGCIALRRFDTTSGEVKRLFVRPAFRGQGIGLALVMRAIQEARAIGYHRLLLDTLPQMERARKIYAQLGFREIPAYYDNPIEGASYMELILGGKDGN